MGAGRTADVEDMPARTGECESHGRRVETFARSQSRSQISPKSTALRHAEWTKGSGLDGRPLRQAGDASFSSAAAARSRAGRAPGMPGRTAVERSPLATGAAVTAR